METELSLEKLSGPLASVLWAVGELRPPVGLQAQLLSHQLYISEDISHHLTRDISDIYLKPLPSYLLKRPFWDQHLRCDFACDRTDLARALQEPSLFAKLSESCKLHRAATGFIYSYCAILQHESDFCVAQDKRLIPQDIDWPAWRTMAQDLIGHPKWYRIVDFRFWFGELNGDLLILLAERFEAGYSNIRSPGFWLGFPRSHNSFAGFGITHTKRAEVVDQYYMSVRKVIGYHYTLLLGAAFWLIFILTTMQVGLAAESESEWVFSDTAQVLSKACLLMAFSFATLIPLYSYGMFVGQLIGRHSRYRLRQKTLVRTFTEERSS